MPYHTFVIEPREKKSRGGLKQGMYLGVNQNYRLDPSTGIDVKRDI